MLEMVDHPIDGALLWVDRERVQHEAEETARGGERAELVVVEVPRRVVHGAAAAVRAEDRRARGALEELRVDARRRVREVEDDPELDEPVDELAAEPREAAAVLRGPVGKRVPPVPRQAGHPDAERVEDVRRPDLDPEALDALERQHEADPLAGLDAVEIRRGLDLDDPVAVLAHRPVERRDERERLAQRPSGCTVTST